MYRVFVDLQDSYNTLKQSADSDSAALALVKEEQAAMTEIVEEERLTARGEIHSMREASEGREALLESQLAESQSKLDAYAQREAEHRDSLLLLK